MLQTIGAPGIRVVPSHALPSAHSVDESRPKTTYLVVSFVAAVFALDLATGLGMPYWLLYGAPFFFIRYHHRRSIAYALAALCTILLLAAYALSPEGKAEPLTERASAAIVLWVLVIALARRRPRRRLSLHAS
jgi:hypothetical protein